MLQALSNIHFEQSEPVAVFYCLHCVCFPSNGSPQRIYFWVASHVLVKAADQVTSVERGNSQVIS